MKRGPSYLLDLSKIIQSHLACAINGLVKTTNHAAFFFIFLLFVPHGGSFIIISQFLLELFAQLNAESYKSDLFVH